MKQRHHLSMWLAIAPLLLLFSTCTRPYAGEEARKALCAHNLRQIGRALSQYREENGSFPPPVIMDHDLGIQYSWRIALLPYVEEAALFSDYRFDEPWNSKANQAVTREMPRVYRCPSNYNEPDMHTNYSMVVTTTGHDTNGRDETASRSRVVIVEVANAGIHWAEPCDVELNEVCPQIDGPNAVSIGSHHPNGAHVLYADGSVEFLSEQLVRERFRTMVDNCCEPGRE